MLTLQGVLETYGWSLKVKGDKINWSSQASINTHIISTENLDLATSTVVHSQMVVVVTIKGLVA